MIIQSSPQAVSDVRSDSSSTQAGGAVDQNSKIIRFPGTTGIASQFAFRPAAKNADSISPFKPKRLMAGRSKGRFKLSVYKPGRYQKTVNQARAKIVDAGFGLVPVDYFPEVA